MMWESGGGGEQTQWSERKEAIQSLIINKHQRTNIVNHNQFGLEHLSCASGSWGSTPYPFSEVWLRSSGGEQFDLHLNHFNQTKIWALSIIEGILEGFLLEHTNTIRNNHTSKLTPHFRLQLAHFERSAVRYKQTPPRQGREINSNGYRV